jgi:hypothetical protein
MAAPAAALVAETLTIEGDRVVMENFSVDWVNGQCANKRAESKVRCNTLNFNG